MSDQRPSGGLDETRIERVARDILAVWFAGRPPVAVPVRVLISTRPDRADTSGRMRHARRPNL